LNIKSIYKKFGSGKKLNTYPLLSFYGYLAYRFFPLTKVIPLLNYINYDKNEALKFFSENIGWRDYGGKHYESLITKFYQAYILLRKFGIDKRKAHLSSLICANQITREESLLQLKKPPYETAELNEDKKYFLKKLQLDEKEFDHIMDLNPKTHMDYPSYNLLIKKVYNFFNGK